MPDWNIGKSVLLVGVGFYNYEMKIKECMEKKGYAVDLVFDTPKNDTALQRIVSERVRRGILKRHQQSILEHHDIGRYDHIIVIVGRYIQSFFLKEMRSKKKDGTKLTLYLWDDVARVENFGEVYGMYDEVYSFDPADCASRGLSFLPLFYTNEFVPSKEKKKFDIYSAIYDHSDRLEIVNRIIKQFGDKDLFFIVTQGWIGFMRNLFHHPNYGGRIVYKNKPITKEKNNAYMSKAKCVLDVQVPSQIGLTIRTMEALACKVKLITTNASIRNYDFFHPNNVWILDRKKPVVDLGFIELPYHDLTDDIYNKYSLGSWIDVLLGKGRQKYLMEDNEYGLQA